MRIGLETHLQLNTKSKIFCSCANPVGPLITEEPSANTLTCETCLGMPGSRPRFNRAVLDAAIKVALALDCKIAPETFFSRKTYFYPDMSKNFQITQYEVPVAEAGKVKIESDNGKQKIAHIRRVHMEEDPAKVVHVGGLGGKYVLVDYNRSGIPLLEIVTEPDFSSPAEARQYLAKLAVILEYLRLYDPASRAVFKSDANISLTVDDVEGAPDGFISERVEIKNITGTKEIEEALNYEIVRQKNQIKVGKQVERETRAWNPDLGTTQPLRGKEGEAEYGYIFEPDLPKMEVGVNLINASKKQIPELPDEKMSRFVNEYKLPGKVAESLIGELDLANLFEKAAAENDIGSRTAGTWIAGCLKKTLNWNNVRFRDSGLEDGWIISLLKMFKGGKLTDKNAEMAIRKMVEEKRPPEKIVAEYNMERSDVTDALVETIKGIVKKNQKAVDDYKSGNHKAIYFIIGECMKETRGRVDANEVKKIVLSLVK